jgi:hypothetical protein
MTTVLIYNGTYLRTQPPAHVPRLRMESGEIGSRRADCAIIVDRPLQCFVTLQLYCRSPELLYRLVLFRA